ncbi:hypothetical protein BU24DRAFT_424599 [Aaosphaeria arxii CBS 175.79]|uniref:Uncharacterized protein n=1 Tax=Aaosphaeria arxii CBS 175.79 TaxID=1450172 RepID=A0A6A5XL61_9PLEO|nr:uncharacterized protein BU24DRAFT_424599 [Aaosphaeria arxii CBS 175.79]KAF2013601.1 hypothetical protein BU24DRAFT_424599 [Aaosphaeria arxii CBS 175.79]
MSKFTFWKGFADAAVGVILLTKPELIYHSAVAKTLHRLSGLRLPNPHPTAEDAISSQHAVAIMVIAVGVGHMRASSERKALPPIVLMNLIWSLLALGTVVLKPHRATSALLMTGINHAVFATIMILRARLSVLGVLGIKGGVLNKSE